MRDYTKRLYSSRVHAQALHQQCHGIEDGFLCDITDGEAYVVLKNSLKDGRPLQETDIVLGVFTDGVLAFKDDRTYSVYPVAITCYNFSRDIRQAIIICADGLLCAS